VSPEPIELVHHLRAAMGWLELDLPRDALAELDRLPAAAQENPDVLEVRWLVLAHLNDWDAALPVTRRLIGLAPDRASSWLHHAYALRRASEGGLLAAFQVLAPVAAKFPGEATIAYNLACYTCQLQRGGAETMAWFERALTIGNPAELIEMALNDSDLAPARDLIEPLRKKFRKR
jgi:predicted Zn-dependent protease